MYLLSSSDPGSLIRDSVIIQYLFQSQVWTIRLICRRHPTMSSTCGRGRTALAQSLRMETAPGSTSASRPQSQEYWLVWCRQFVCYTCFEKTFTKKIQHFIFGEKLFVKNLLQQPQCILNFFFWYYNSFLGIISSTYA